MSIGNAFPERATIPGVDHVKGVWTGGGAAANCTHAAADWSKGIASLNYNAATGKYKLTFTDCGQQIVGGKVEVMRAAGDAPIKANICRATFSSTAKTVEVEFWDLATPALIDVLTTDKICVDVEFSKAAP